MKDLHLFTPISERLPSEKGFYLAVFYNYYTGKEKIMPFVYEKCYDFDNGSWRVKCWLDLSALTTKEELIKAVKEAYDDCDNRYGAADAFKDMMS